MNAPIVAYLPTSTDLADVTLSYAVVLCVAVMCFGFGYVCNQALGTIQIVLAKRNLRKAVAIELAEIAETKRVRAAIREFDLAQRERARLDAIMHTGRVN